MKQSHFDPDDEWHLVQRAMCFTLMPLLGFALILIVFQAADSISTPIVFSLHAPELISREDAEHLSPTPIFVAIADDGTVTFGSVGREPASSQVLPRLRAHLRGMAPHFRAGGSVVITPSPQTLQQRITDVLAALVACDIRRYYLV